MASYQGCLRTCTFSVNDILGSKAHLKIFSLVLFGPDPRFSKFHIFMFIHLSFFCSHSLMGIYSTRHFRYCVCERDRQTDREDFNIVHKCKHPFIRSGFNCTNLSKWFLFGSLNLTLTLTFPDLLPLPLLHSASYQCTIQFAREKKMSMTPKQAANSCSACPSFCSTWSPLPACSLTPFNLSPLQVPEGFITHCS